MPLRRPGWLRIPFRHRGDQGPAEPETQSVVSHLIELRNRVFISLFSLIPGAIAGFVFGGQIIHVLRAPLPTSEPLVVLGLTDAIMIQFQVAIVSGVIVGMPVILFQFWRYISPGLTPRERSMARPWVPVALLFFLIGVTVAWVILPFAVSFLLGFQTEDLTYLPTADAYFGFVATLFLAFGLTMEFPIVLVLLSKVGIITSKRLRSSRRIVILGIAIFAAVVTPGGDLVSPTVLGVVMYILYEVSIVLVKAGGH